ncbi:Crp/Fnr family transcriptional regulator [Niabella aurantiaca]|uniref:Crp/Fnr family transcriptional regulator n=1 Tax=Niabella aurantiaca TaxID=379900 RepID=UPI00036ED314|nr:Crp/Fnr family transcriptional regulator [Niabella aurantiaca]
MEEIKSFVKKYFDLDLAHASIEAFACLLKPQQFNKGDLIFNDRSVCKNLYFIKKGLVKFYFINENGKEVIFRFFAENTYFTSLESFLNHKNAAQFAKAIENTEVFFLNKTELDRLIASHPAVAGVYKSMFATVNTNMIKRFSELMSCDAAERYENFLKNNSALLQRISLGDLASYLGITQESLSRIRARK